jgi:beta-lactamase class A
MDEIITSVQGSTTRDGRRRGRHKAAPPHAAPPRLRLIALVPLGLVTSLVAAHGPVGSRATSEVVVTVSPSVVEAARSPERRATRDAARSPSTRAARPSFSSVRNGVTCTGPATSAARSLALRVQTYVGPALRATGVRIAFAGDDTATGIRCTSHPTVHYDSASIVKVAIVAALLDQRRSAHRTLSRTERAWAKAAITRSDNNAASALWRRVGGAAGMRAFFARAGMRHTTPGSGGVWGLTQVTAADELTLLRRVTRPGLLASADRTYLQGLMASVVKGQRWGVPVGAPASSHVGLKNGWLPRATRGWRVHSIGWVRLRTTTYEVVILTDGNRSLTGGIGHVDSVARAVHKALGRRR